MLDQAQLVRDAVRLRRVHHRHPTDEDLVAVRADLERAAGPTVGRAATARLLGVSQTALDRWIAAGDVPVVVTARGRREVPLRTVLDLVEAVEANAGRPRPLAAAIKALRTNDEPATTLRQSSPFPGMLEACEPSRRSAYHRVDAMTIEPFDIDRKTWQSLDAEKRRLLRPAGLSIEDKLRRGQRLSAQAAALRRGIIRDEPPVRRS
ncbi:MAG TPA: hypothetical protein VGO48_09710 [Conexibacter sp.]|jgi:hypothetical protein|nr:hypothetical protein [Conexibacter sp.]